MKKHQGDLSTYRASYLECRPGMSGHSWRWQTDFKVLRNTKGEITEFSRLRRCSRCKAKSIKVYDGKTGRLVRRWYDYTEAPGYMISRESFKYEPGMAALEALHRAVDSGKIVEE